MLRGPFGNGTGGVGTRLTPSLFRFNVVHFFFRRGDVEDILKWHVARSEVDAGWKGGDLRNGDDCR